MQVHSLGWEDTLEEEMATHSSILAWETPWTEGTGTAWSREPSIPPSVGTFSELPNLAMYKLKFLIKYYL